jgi:hypothetical protein
MAGRAGALVRAALAVSCVLVSCASASDASLDESPFSCVHTSVSESAALSCLLAADGSAFASVDKDDAGRAVEEALNRAWFDLATRIVEVSGAVDISTVVHQTSTKIRNKLTAVAESLGKASTAAGIPPAFEWAQSPDALFLNGASRARGEGGTPTLGPHLPPFPVPPLPDAPPRPHTPSMSPSPQ